MTKFFAVLAGVLALLLLGTTAQAKPAPAPQPYAPAQEIIKKTETAADSQATVRMKLICPAGKIVTGGGFDSGSTYLRSDDGTTEPNGGEDNLNSPIRRSYLSALDSWTVEFDPDRMGLQAVTAYAVCIAAAAPTS